MITKDNYITIQGFMIKDLNLSGNELLLYAIIYGFSQGKQGLFTGRNKYLADWLNCSTRTIERILNKLVKDNLLEKITIYPYDDCETVTINHYKAIIPKDSGNDKVSESNDKVSESNDKVSQGGTSECRSHIDNNNIDNNIHNTIDNFYILISNFLETNFNSSTQEEKERFKNNCINFYKMRENKDFIKLKKCPEMSEQACKIFLGKLRNFKIDDLNVLSEIVETSILRSYTDVFKPNFDKIRGVYNSVDKHVDTRPSADDNDYSADVDVIFKRK